jgi:hypothetical protein
MITEVKNRMAESEGSLPDQLANLQAQVDRLEKLLAAQNGAALVASNALLARESRRQRLQEQAAKEVKGGKLVNVRVQRFAEKMVDKRVVKVDNSRPITLSSTWRSRGIWPGAPSALLPADEKGEPLTYKIPERVHDALKDELVLV